MSPHHTRFSYATSLAFALAFGLLGLLWLGNPSPTAHAQSLPEALGSISGVVRNTQGDPLPNMQVALLQDVYGSSIRQTTTDAQGEYLLLSVPPGAYKVRFEDNAKVYATEYYDNATRWSTASALNVSGNNLTGIDTQLAPGGTISVTLEPTPSITNTSLTLTLYARTPTNRWEIVDTLYWPYTDPELTFYGIPDGRYTVCVQNTPMSDAVGLAQCYEDKLQESYTQPPADAKEILIEGTTQQHITLDFGDFIQFQGIVKSSTGHPLTNIQLTLEGLAHAGVYSTITDAQGRFTFPRLQEDTYTVLMMDDSKVHLRTYYENALTLTQAKPIKIDASSRYSLTLTMQRAGSITGTIRTEGGIIPNNVSIRPLIPWAGGWNDTDGICYLDTCRSTYEPFTGVYTITGVSTGKYRLKVYELFEYTGIASGYYGGTTLQDADDIFVTTGETTANINVVLETNDFEGSIRGRATASDAPQANITVGLFREVFDPFNQPDMPFVTVQTDAQGNYRFDGLPNGFYRVGFYDQTGKYALTFYGNDLEQPPMVGITGTTTVENINAELTPGGTIRGSIKRAAGENPADFRIYIRVISYNALQSFGGVLPFAQITSDVNGNFEIAGLPLGTYRIGALSPDDLPYPAKYRFYPYGQNESYQGDILVRPNSVVTGINIPIDLAPTVYLPIIGTVGGVGE